MDNRSPIVDQLTAAGSRFLPNSPVPEEQLTVLEQVVGPLPAELRDVLRTFGGGHLRNSADADGVVIDLIADIQWANEDQMDDLFDETTMPDIFVFGSDGGGGFFFYDQGDHAGRGKSSVCWAHMSDPSMDQALFCASSLTAFVGEINAGVDWRERATPALASKPEDSSEFRPTALRRDRVVYPE